MAGGAADIAKSIEAVVRAHAAATAERPDVLVGLIGRGIKLSRSPGMHEREAARLGLRCAYLLIDFDALGLDDDDLGEAVRAAASLGFHGVNVTHPFKQAAIAHLDEVSPEARAIGAINTIVFGPRIVGHNTDCWGFAESFRTDMAGASLDRVVLLGAGGAGSAVGYALAGLGAGEIAVVDQDRERAAALAARLGGASDTRFVVAGDLAQALGSAAGVVNTTPMGMEKYPGSPVPATLLRPDLWVADVVYFPQETELLREARRAGCRTLAGIGMAIGQAARAFELFTGRAADMDAMARHFEAAA